MAQRRDAPHIICRHHGLSCRFSYMKREPNLFFIGKITKKICGEETKPFTKERKQRYAYPGSHSFTAVCATPSDCTYIPP